MSTIAEEIADLNTNLQAAKAAVTAKGGAVSDTGLAGLAAEIASIPSGGGGGKLSFKVKSAILEASNFVFSSCEPAYLGLNFTDGGRAFLNALFSQKNNSLYLPGEKYDGNGRLRLSTYWQTTIAPNWDSGEGELSFFLEDNSSGMGERQLLGSLSDLNAEVGSEEEANVNLWFSLLDEATTIEQTYSADGFIQLCSSYGADDSQYISPYRVNASGLVFTAKGLWEEIIIDGEQGEEKLLVTYVFRNAPNLSKIEGLDKITLGASNSPIELCKNGGRVNSLIKFGDGQTFSNGNFYRAQFPFTIDVGTCQPPTANDLTAFTNMGAAALASGITIKGANRQAWLTKYPNIAGSRNLVDGGE